MARAYLPTPRPTDMTNAPMDLAIAIAEELTRQGHAVTYFAPAGSHLGAKVETLNLPPLAHNLQEFAEVMADEAKTSHNILGLWDQYMVREVFERARAGEFDLVHLHHPEAGLALAKLYPDVPVVYTIHDPIEGWFREALNMYRSPNQYFVSISGNQRITAPDLPYVATVHNGIDTELFSYHHTGSDYLLFSGRITPEKGVREAIQVAKEAGMRLLIIGPVYEGQREYFEAHIKPQLDDNILYLGMMERKHIVTYYQKARALLFPIQWEEPFGLTMIETMACGTPVIALRRGSVPEVIEDGKTGFVVDSLAEMVAAVHNVDSIDRAACRKHVEQHFSTSHMVKNYLRTYEQVLEQSRKRTRALV